MRDVVRGAIQFIVSKRKKKNQEVGFVTYAINGVIRSLVFMRS